MSRSCGQRTGCRPSNETVTISPIESSCLGGSECGKTRLITFSKHPQLGTSLTAKPYGSITLGTTVLLTGTGPKSILLGIEHCPTYQGRRKPIEKMDREGVYRFNTGSSLELLDIGALRYRLPPGLYYTSEAQCHVNSQLFCSPC